MVYYWQIGSEMVKLVKVTKLIKLEIKMFKSLKNIDSNGQTCGPGFLRVRIKSRLFMVEVIIGGFFPQIGFDDVLPSFITSLFPPVQIIPSSLKLTCIRVDFREKDADFMSNFSTNFPKFRDKNVSN